MMPTAPEAATSTPKQRSLRPTRARHAVLALTVAVYMITYMDRTIIASAMPLIQKEFGFSLITVGWILASFRWGFTLFQLPGAWFGDKIGPRRAQHPPPTQNVISWDLTFMHMEILSRNSALVA